MALQDELKKARHNKRLTQKQLGHSIGVDHTTISLYESGDRQPSLNALIQMSAVLEVSLDTLLAHELQQLTIVLDDKKL